LGDEIEEVVMGGACGTYEGEEKDEYSVSVPKLK
jgi:hypothetical protein